MAFFKARSEIGCSKWSFMVMIKVKPIEKKTKKPKKRAE